MSSAHPDTGFAAIPDARTWRVANAHLPLCVTEGAALAADAQGLAKVDLTIEAGNITSILPAGLVTFDHDQPVLDLDGGMILPRLVDCHTHLDKGHIWPRRPNPDGTFMGALENTGADREANWSASDVATRMDFALRCAFAHGTAAIRTHIDSLGTQIGISWPVLADIRARWAGRIALQATPLFGIQSALDATHMRDVVAAVNTHGDKLFGCVTYMIPELDQALDIIFTTAMTHGFDLDFHVDETNDPAARSLEHIADAALRHRFTGKILCGHCCSLALQAPQDEARIIAKVVEARIAIVSLPMCNMYLQDRRAGLTPRWRGVTALHELKSATVPVMVASDNTRDPFYAYGDLDLLEVLREATRIAHLDHSGPDWVCAISSTPANVMGLEHAGRVAAGQPADLILLRARNWNEAFSRPQSNRTVLVNGQAIDTQLPDHRELDHLMTSK
jgi:cytosine/creatinine deaminase